MTVDLEKPLTQIVEDLRCHRINALQLLNATLERQRQLATPLQAYKFRSEVHAQALAKAADAAFESGTPSGPLQGIPISVKDLFGVSGLPTFAGTPRQLPEKWESEGPTVQLLRRQLAVITGKTHTVEMAFGGLGVNTHWGTPRNPWDAENHRVPGGSSSGAGVSLAEGSALLALGTDTAGSVRIPASMTGNAGLKTSAGRWSCAGVVPLSPSLDSVGILGRSVADLSYAFGALDPSWGDPTRFLSCASGLDLRGVIIGRVDTVLWDGCAPGIVEAVDRSLQELTQAGARVVDVTLPEVVEAIELLQLGSVVSAECDEFLSAELPAWRELVSPELRVRIEDGGRISAHEYLSRKRRLSNLAASTHSRFGEIAVLASPTVAITPPTLEQVASLENYRPANVASLRNTCIANYCGLCAVTIPVGLDGASMPVGLQLMARHGTEERLLAIALASEGVLGDTRQRLGRPPLTA